MKRVELLISIGQLPKASDYFQQAAEDAYKAKQISKPGGCHINLYDLITTLDSTPKLPTKLS